MLNLCELRSTLGEGARLARLPGRTVVTARHVADATDRVGRANLWRLCEMALRDGGRLYLEVLTGRGGDDPFAAEHHLRPQPLGRVVAEIEGRGGTVVARRQTRTRRQDGSAGHRTGRLVVEWRR